MYLHEHGMETIFSLILVPIFIGNSEAFASLFSCNLLFDYRQKNPLKVLVPIPFYKVFINEKFSVKSGAPDVFGSSVRESSKLELPE